MEGVVLEVDAVKGQFQGLERLFTSFFGQFTSPNSDAMPSHRRQPLLHLDITLAVTCDFLLPKVAVRLGQTKSTAVMSMPETTIDEDARAIFVQHHVRMSR